MPEMPIPVRVERRVLDSYLHCLLIFVLLVMWHAKQRMSRVNRRVFHLFVLGNHQKNELFLENTHVPPSTDLHANSVARPQSGHIMGMRPTLLLGFDNQTVYQK